MSQAQSQQTKRNPVENRSSGIYSVTLALRGEIPEQIRILKTGIYASRIIFIRGVSAKMPDDRTSIKLEKRVRNRLRSAKRGGETYNQLLDRMLEQYDPEEAGR